jgi:hypothetical protein
MGSGYAGRPLRKELFMTPQKPIDHHVLKPQIYPNQHVEPSRNAGNN